MQITKPSPRCDYDVVQHRYRHLVSRGAGEPSPAVTADAPSDPPGRRRVATKARRGDRRLRAGRPPLGGRRAPPAPGKRRSLRRGAARAPGTGRKGGQARVKAGLAIVRLADIAVEGSTEYDGRAVTIDGRLRTVVNIDGIPAVRHGERICRTSVSYTH